VRMQHRQHSCVGPAALQQPLRAQHSQRLQHTAWTPAARPVGKRLARIISTNSTAEAISIGGWAITVQKGGDVDGVSGGCPVMNAVVVQAARSCKH
jgi:hypothetical protein